MIPSWDRVQVCQSVQNGDESRKWPGIWETSYNLRDWKNNVNSMRSVQRNYLAQLSKISWFVSGEHINCYLLRSLSPRQIIDVQDSDKSRYFVITEVDCFIIQLLFFWSIKDMKSLSDSSRNQSAIFTQAWFQLPMSWILLAAKYLFVGSNLKVTWADEKEGKNTSDDNSIIFLWKNELLCTFPLWKLILVINWMYSLWYLQ